MSAQLIVEYELRNADLVPLKSAVLRFNDSDLVDDLRRRVLQDGSKILPPGYDHSFLDVYPSNSEAQMMTDRSKALRLRTRLCTVGESLIVIARSLPKEYLPGREIENPIVKLRRLLDPSMELDPRVINLIKRRERLLHRLEVACEDERDALELYQDAERTFGTSTKRNIIAAHGSDLKINGEFEISQQSSSVFYVAWDAGIPCILKFPESASTAQLEYKVYVKITDPRKRHLVHIELIQFTNLPTRHLNQNYALKMSHYTSTLQSCARGPELSTLFEHVAVSIFEGIHAIHAAGYCHLDVKPGNIFIDSQGGSFLGDYDAALNPGQLVTRTTPTFLPREMAVLQARNRLVATPAVDFGMLACTLLFMYDVNISASPSIRQLESGAQNLNLDTHPELSRIVLQCVQKLQQDPQIDLGHQLLSQTQQQRSAAVSEAGDVDSESTQSGLEPLI